MFKKLCSIILAIAIVFCCVPSVFGAEEDQEDKGTITLRVKNFMEMEEAMTGTYFHSALYPGYSHYIFVFTQSVYVKRAVSLYSDPEITITAESSGIAIKRGEFTGPMLTTYGKLTLENITIDGSLPNGIPASSGMIYNQGTLTLGQGLVLKNNKVAMPDFLRDSRISGKDADDFSNTILGGAIYNEGTLIMEQNAEISGTSGHCFGGGIFNTGSVTMADNTKISNCDAGMGGGIYNYGGKVTIQGATAITGNAATDGGGIYNNGGEITIRDTATIAGNTAYGGGIYNKKGKILVTDNTIINNNTSRGEGGGIYNEDTLLLGGSVEMKDNTASQGAGISNYGAVTMSEYATVKNNTASPYSMHVPVIGGGIYNAGSFEMIDHASIKDNRVITGRTVDGVDIKDGCDGGGVFISESGTFQMRGEAEVSGNSAAHKGGGIYSISEQELIMQDNARVLNNKAGEAGGGIYSSKGSIYLAETARVSDNQALEHADVFGETKPYVDTEQQPEPRPNPQQEPEPQPDAKPEQEQEHISETSNEVVVFIVLSGVVLAVVLLGIVWTIKRTKKKRAAGEAHAESQAVLGDAQEANAAETTDCAEQSVPSERHEAKKTKIMTLWRSGVRLLKNTANKVVAGFKALCARLARGVLKWASPQDTQQSSVQ